MSVFTGSVHSEAPFSFKDYSGGKESLLCFLRHRQPPRYAFLMASLCASSRPVPDSLITPDSRT